MGAGVPDCAHHPTSYYVPGRWPEIVQIRMLECLGPGVVGGAGSSFTRSATGTCLPAHSERPEAGDLHDMIGSETSQMGTRTDSYSNYGPDNDD